MVVVIQHLDALIAGKRDNLCAKLPERLMHRRLNGCKLRLCLLKILALNGNGKVTLLIDSLPAFMYLLLHDVVVDLSEPIIAVILLL